MSVREFLHGCRVPNYSAHPVTGSKALAEALAVAIRPGDEVQRG